MTEVQVYGASDDTIVVAGALSEEYPAIDGYAYVYVSTGDVVRFRLEAEGWRASLVVDVTGPGVTRDERDDDVVNLAGPVGWLVVTKHAPLLAPDRAGLVAATSMEELAAMLAAAETSAARLCPDATFVVRLHSVCVWCRVPIARASGPGLNPRETWWHTEPVAASPYIHVAEPSKTVEPYAPGRG